MFRNLPCIRSTFFRKLTGVRLEDIYNLMLAKGWTLGASTGLKLMHGVDSIPTIVPLREC